MQEGVRGDFTMIIVFATRSENREEIDRRISVEKRIAPCVSGLTN